MDITAPLPPELEAVLQLGGHSFHETASAFEMARALHAASMRHSAHEMVFQHSLMLKNELDRLAQDRGTTASLQLVPLETVSVLLHAEFLLYELHKGVPLRHNPFLSHWVEALGIWDERLRARKRDDWLTDSSSKYTRYRTWWFAHKARVVLVGEILAGRKIESIRYISALDFYEANCTSGLNELDLAPYIKMLEEEGIYERDTTASANRGTSPSPSKDEPSAAPLQEPTTPSSALAPRPKGQNDSNPSQQSSTMSMTDLAASLPDSSAPATPFDLAMQTLASNPSDGISQIVRGDISIPSLEFLNSIIFSPELKFLPIQPVEIIRQYLDRSLITVERMRPGPALPSPPLLVEQASASAGPSASASSYGNHGAEDDDLEPVERGRDAQIRAVSLLLLFLRNLLRKGVVSPESPELWFQFQEIGTRYIWMEEVREFRKLLAELGGESGKAGKTPG